MTDHEQTTEPELSEARVLVEAFADGDPVERAALSAALADPAAREHLLDILILRDAVGSMSPPRWQQTRRSRAPWLAAAAAVVLSVTAGYYAGQRAMAADPAHVTIETSIAPATPAIAPTPTRVVTLEPGVNWEGR